MRYLKVTNRNGASGHTQEILMFRVVLWDIRTSETSVDNHFTRQYIPEYNSEHHTRRRDNLKSHKRY
jgi:hypothetical protein